MDAHPFRFFRNLSRSREIATVLLNQGFGDMVDRLNLRRYLQWGRRVFSRRTPTYDPPRTRAERIRLALESLGATYIKFGQVISTRPDLIPEDVICELAKLQEKVPPFSSEVAVACVERSLGRPIGELFAAFEREPLAAGSLGQVHRARTFDGQQLAVKIRRPNVVKDVERDLSLMVELAALIERHMPEAEVFDPIGLVAHFSRTIRRELNFAREGRTIDEFAKLFRNDATLHVPVVHWEFTSEDLLTTEFMEGCHATDLEGLRAAGVSGEQVAANGARIFMKMAFELGMFHGDPHPGNLRVMPDGSIGLLDFGMVGTLEDDKREKLIDLFLAITKRDVCKAVEVIREIGQPYRPIDVILLRADVRDFVENYYGVPLEQLHVGRMLTDFVAILSNHGIRCPADLMLLIRAIVTLEGVGRELDPRFNLAEHLAPFVEQLVRDRYNPRRILDKVLSEARMFAQVAHDAPLQLSTTLDKLSRDDLRIQLEHRGLEHLITELDRSSNRIVVSLAMSSLIVASALIIRVGTNLVWLSLPVFILSSLLGIWLIYGVFRSGRL